MFFFFYSLYFIYIQMEKRGGENNKKKNMLFFTIVFFFFSLYKLFFCQEWDILKGSTWTSCGSPPCVIVSNYTNQYEYHQDNTPGGRTFSGHCTQDKSLFIFGGWSWVYEDFASKIYLHNDVWEYDIELVQWRYYNGSKQLLAYPPTTPNDIYSDEYHPRRSGAMAMICVENTILFFGGGHDALESDSDVLENSYNWIWQYNLSNLQWRFRKGNKSENINGYYGINWNLTTSPNFTESAYPASRHGVAHFHITREDSKDYLVVFGGFNNNIEDSLSDVWEYSISINQWRHLYKTSQEHEDNGNYVDKGSFSAASYPMARGYPAFWKINNDLFCVYGGAWKTLKNFFLSDTWCFDMDNNQWKWANGPEWASGFNQPAEYGILNEFGDDVIPEYGSLFLQWVVTEDILFLYGGKYDNNIAWPNIFARQQFFEYSVSNDQWRWIDGLNGTYDELEDLITPDPKGRYAAASFEYNDKLMFFGGMQQGTQGAGFDWYDGQRDTVWRYKWDCYGLDVDNPLVCFGNGECIAQDTCECDDPGPQCYYDTNVTLLIETYVNIINGLNDDLEECNGNLDNQTTCCLNKTQELEECNGNLDNQTTCCLNKTQELEECNVEKEIQTSCCLNKTQELESCLNQSLPIVENCTSLHQCFGIFSDNQTVCNGNGWCSQNGSCICSEGWSGDVCDVPTCNGFSNDNITLVCNGRGLCTSPNVCVCARWMGTFCEYLKPRFIVIITIFIVLFIFVVFTIFIILIWNFFKEVLTYKPKEKSSKGLESEIELLLQKNIMKNYKKKNLFI
jgi:hypothetical protein